MSDVQRASVVIEECCTHLATMKINMFGKGFTLQLAITVACEMAFILFGKALKSHSVEIQQVAGLC